jgi:hypothetical protein
MIVPCYGGLHDIQRKFNVKRIFTKDEIVPLKGWAVNEYYLIKIQARIFFYKTVLTKNFNGCIQELWNESHFLYKHWYECTHIFYSCMSSFILRPGSSFCLFLSSAVAARKWKLVRIRILKVVTMKIIVFWGVTPCNLVDRY